MAYTSGSTNGLQHPGPSTQREEGRLMHPLPQRPMSYRSLADSTTKRPREVCLNFLAGRCRYGNECSRIHPRSNEQSHNFSVATHDGPSVPTTIFVTPVPPLCTDSKPGDPSLPSPGPASTNSVQVLDGVYVDRFGKTKPWNPDSLHSALPALPPADGQSEDLLHQHGNLVRGVPALSSHLPRSSPLTQKPLALEPRVSVHPPALTSSQPPPPRETPPVPVATLPAPSTAPQPSIAEPTEQATPLDAHPALLVAEDTRPSRVGASL
ncbi:hypothetical protein BD309DRAFT_107921 [Dichomitus squalens]|nr:hypothetical protein BD309DRAFT_107921 [Dichomitus squalens]